jgi:hypothetical protein
VSAAADGATCRSQCEENHANDEQDDPDRVQNRDAGNKADDQKDQAKNDQCELLTVRWTRKPEERFPGGV